MILLVRIAHVEPKWQFSGHVDAPEFQQVAAHQSGRDRSATARSSQRKKGGFWAALKRAFGGRDETQN
jgi:hypothetical protein